MVTDEWCSAQSIPYTVDVVSCICFSYICTFENAIEKIFYSKTLTENAFLKGCLFFRNIICWGIQNPVKQLRWSVMRK